MITKIKVEEDLITPNTVGELNNITLNDDIKIKSLKTNSFNKKKAKSDKFTDTKYSVNGVKMHIKELTSYRELMKMPKLDLKIRQCLKCFDKFHSVNKGNRLCDVCTKV